MDILRFITAGSVDDGKSTLIGRLLYDTNNIKTDIISSISGNDAAGANINLAYVTDGLRSEREQGITIDVAYKYFTTQNRKFIITDAPGHFQYTRNLVTGASGVDLMIILIDARHGITSQTRNHSMVASFLKINKIVVAINKMDIVGYDEAVYNKIKDEYDRIAIKLNLTNISFIPISALIGDNVCTASTNMPWYNGTNILNLLENHPVYVNQSNVFRFQVQYVLNINYNECKLGYAGKIISGSIRTHDKISINNYKDSASIGELLIGYNPTNIANEGQNVVIYLESEKTFSRGDIFHTSNTSPFFTHEILVTVCWLDNNSGLNVGDEFIIRIGAMETKCIIKHILDKTDSLTLDKYWDNTPVTVNQIASILIHTKSPIPIDKFDEIPENGRGIIINMATNYTSGAIVITG